MTALMPLLVLSTSLVPAFVIFLLDEDQQASEPPSTWPEPSASSRW
jgi:hypothetical protein